MKGRFNPLLYAFLRCHFPFFSLVKFYLPKPMKGGQTQAPAWFNTTESHSWGWAQRLFLESSTDSGMLWEPCRAATVSQTEGEVLRMWTASLEFCLTASEWRICQRGVWRPPYPPSSSPSTSLFIHPAGHATKTPNILKPPQCFVLLIFPLRTDGGKSQTLKWRKDARRKRLKTEYDGGMEQFCDVTLNYTWRRLTFIAVHYERIKESF